MKANHTPRSERLLNRVRSLEHRRDSYHIESPHRGNPYWCCKDCGIHDPQLSIQKGRHFRGCSMQGIDKQIAYFRRLLEEEMGNGT